ncbi:MAG: GTPase Era [Spirochaetaceae bacterium]|jgi:GTP-binding protein Era|nr:GTPase Era [Spirochaetaceae bacterium]
MTENAEQYTDDGTSPGTKAAVAVIIGRPSSGKSTFLNTVCGEKVSIVSETPQTTRNAVRGIINSPRGQIVFIDTPGYHDSEKKLNLKLKAVAEEHLREADALLYIIDSSRVPGREEELVASLIESFSAKTVVAVNKIDRPESDTQAIRDFLSGHLPGIPSERIAEISAEKNIHTESVISLLFDIAPEGEPLYPAEYYTDQAVDFRIAEIIREKAIRATRDEIPHALYVEISDLEQRRNGKELWVRAFLVVERESQKGIVIGKGASVIKEIRTSAQKELNRIFPWYVSLDLQVRVNRNWRQKDPLIGRLTGMTR